MRNKVVANIIRSMQIASQMSSKKVQQHQRLMITQFETLVAKVDSIKQDKSGYQSHEQKLKELAGELSTLKKTMEDHHQQQNNNSQTFNGYFKWLLAQLATGGLATIGAGTAKYIYDNYLSSVASEKEAETADDLIKKYIDATNKCNLLASKIQEADRELDKQIEILTALENELNEPQKRSIGLFYNQVILKPKLSTMLEAQNAVARARAAANEARLMIDAHEYEWGSAKDKLAIHLKEHPNQSNNEELQKLKEKSPLADLAAQQSELGADHEKSSPGSKT